MSSISIDRTDGLSSAAAIKGPCRVATTANITLTGEKTIDGIAVVAGNRVLVKNQTSALENGVYVVDTGPWRRSKDFSRTNDVVKGTQVAITDGTVSGGYIYSLMTDNPIIVGVTSMVFGLSASVAAAAAFAQEASDEADRAQAYANLALNSWGHIAGTGNGVITDIPLAANPVYVANTIVNFDGILQMKSTYVLVDILGVTNIRFSSPIPNGIPYEIEYGNRTNLLTPADGSVTTAKLVDDAVTFAKMQNIATASFIGRKTAGTGDPETLTGADAAEIVEKANWSLDNNTLYKSRSSKDRWLDSYRLADELSFTGGGVTATDSAVLTALFNRAKAAGRKEIILPAGDIVLETACALVNASATNTIRIRGQGPDVTRFLNTSAAQQWFTIGTAAGGRTSGILLEDFSTQSNVAMNDSGSVFYMRNTTDIAFRNIIARSARNGWAMGLSAGVTNDVVYTSLVNCGGTSPGTSGAAMIRLGSGGILQIGGQGTRWNANGGHIFMEQADATYNWDGLYVYGQFFEFFSKYVLSTGKGIVNFEWTGGQVDRASIFFHAEPSIATGSNRNWNIHHTQILGFAAGGAIGMLLGKGSSVDTQAIEDMKVNNNVFNGLSDSAIYAPNGELFAYGNNIVSCAQLGGAAPLGGSLIRVGQGMCYVHGNHGRRSLASPGIAYVTGIQWDGAALASRKEADNQFFSMSGAAQTGTI